MIARVSLELALRKEFDYQIPEALVGQVDVGSRVKVPFGHRQVMGCVTALVENSPHTNLRLVTKVVGKQTLVTPKILKLARWIGEYYCCAPETALKSVLPEAVRKEKEGWKEQLFVRALEGIDELPKLTKRQQEIWKIVEERQELALQELLTLAGTDAGTVRRLEDKGLIQIAAQISERDPYAKENILPTQSLPLNDEQRMALEKIIAAMDRVRVASASGGCDSRSHKARQSPVIADFKFRTPSEESKIDSHPPEAGATPDSVESLSNSGAQKLCSTFLLHGVTGSGKTEVYLQAIAHTLEQGKGAIVLVPEISLTPQTVERFKARFSSGPLKTLVAVLHSHLSSGERHDEWHKIRQGRARIVIGARSAIFAPVDPLGLIIVDEEHEHSYKQEESPRYHARDVAVVRGQMENAVVVLGTATPSLETFYNVQKGKYALLELLQRADDKKMPVVRVIDMRQAARKEKGTPIFSPQLKEAITQRLEKKEQTILFLNRRGFATSLQCPLCGYVAECPNCSVSLTYHRAAQKLACHICGHDQKAPTVCPEPKCRNPQIRYSGLGTEKVESTLVKLFPNASIRRMDSDTLKRKEDYRNILGDFKRGKIDILVGTQMIAKGLHFPNVTLVGIIYADLSLHVPDFRAGERTFQLLTQVSGRAGRGDVEGEVFVQAFTPFHPAIQFARRHDFAGFYEQELEFREQLKYPPLSRVALLTIKGRNEEKVKFSAEHLRKELDVMTSASVGEKAGKWESETAEFGFVGQKEEAPAPTPSPTHFQDLVIAGPAPAPLARAETLYRYQIMLRTKQMSRLSQILSHVTQRIQLPEEVTVVVDIDPVNLS